MKSFHLRIVKNRYMKDYYMFWAILFTIFFFWVNKILLVIYFLKKIILLAFYFFIYWEITLTISKWCGGITVPQHTKHCGFQQQSTVHSSFFCIFSLTFLFFLFFCIFFLFFHLFFFPKLFLLILLFKYWPG